MTFEEAIEKVEFYLSQYGLDHFWMDEQYAEQEAEDKEVLAALRAGPPNPSNVNPESPKSAPEATKK